MGQLHEYDEPLSAVTARTNLLDGVDEIVLSYGFSEVVHPGSWAEANDLARRAGFDHVEYTHEGTVWTRRP